MTRRGGSTLRKFVFTKATVLAMLVGHASTVRTMSEAVERQSAEDTDIQVVLHDPEWAQLYFPEARRVESIFGERCAAIDFGCMGVGDIACDLSIAWTFFTGAARHTFLSAVTNDDATWARARGWALWKALILLAWQNGPAEAVADSRRVLDEVLAG